MDAAIARASTNPDLARALADRLRRGDGVPKDVHRAMLLYKAAAKLGDTKSLFLLGDCVLRESDVPGGPAEAAKLFTLAASKGSPEAMVVLASLYRKGNGVPRDEATMMQYLQQAANSGFAPAQLALGMHLLSRDEAAATVLIQRAADAGDRDAATVLQKLSQRAARKRVAAAPAPAPAQALDVTPVVAPAPRASAPAAAPAPPPPPAYAPAPAPAQRQPAHGNLPLSFPPISPLAGPDAAADSPPTQQRPSPVQHRPPPARAQGASSSGDRGVLQALDPSVDGALDEAAGSAMKQMGQAARAAAREHASAGMCESLDGALAAVGVVFPPVIAVKALLGVFKLCARVKQAYDTHLRVIDEEVPNLLERVQALEDCLKHVEQMRVLGKEPAGLVSLLEEACELCESCLPRGEEGNKGFKAFMQRARHFVRARCDKKREAFQTMHVRLSQAVGDLSFVVQVHQFEMVKHTQDEAYQQRCSILRQMLYMEEWQHRVARDAKVEALRQRVALEQMQQAVARVEQEVQAGRMRLEEVAVVVHEEREAVARVEDMAGKQLQAMMDMLHRLSSLAVRVDAYRAEAAAVAAAQPPVRAASAAAAAEPGTPSEAGAAAEVDVLRLTIPPSLLRPWRDLLADDGSGPLQCNAASMIGAGGFGMVFKARQRCMDGTSVPVAVKMLDVESLTPSDVQLFAHEVSIQMHCAGHPNVLSVRAAVADAEHGRYAMIMDRCAADLHAVVHGQVEVRPALGDPWHWRALTLRERLRKMQGIVSAVAFMHDLRVCHNDLKPSNVLVDRETGLLLLTDFGLARTVATVTRLVTSGRFSRTRLAVHAESTMLGPGAALAPALPGAMAGGTVPYMAPEQMGAMPKPRPASDVYALGMLLFEVLVAERPKQPDTTVLEAAAWREGLPALVPLLQRCLAHDRHARPSSRQLHAEITGMLAAARPADVPVVRSGSAAVEGSAADHSAADISVVDSAPVVSAAVGSAAAARSSTESWVASDSPAAPTSPDTASGSVSLPAVPRAPTSGGLVLRQRVADRLEQYLQRTEPALWNLSELLEAASLRAYEVKIREVLGVEEVQDVLELEDEDVTVLALPVLQRKHWHAMQNALRKFVE